MMQMTFALLLFVQPTAAIEHDENGLPFRDVSATHMPNPPLIVQAKDARPIDIDGDGDLDIVIAHEYRANVLLENIGGGRFENRSGTTLPPNQPG